MNIVEIEGHPVILDYLDDYSIIYDCGACVGEFTNKMLMYYNCYVYAYEPDPRNFRKLRSRFKDNDNVILHNVGIGNEVGIEEFFIGKFITASSFYKSHRGLSGESVEVLVSTLDEEIDTADLLKLDLEGSEIEIIPKISRATLSNIKQITVEFHPQSQIEGYTKEKIDICRNYLKEQFDEIMYVDKGNDGHHGLYLNKKYGNEEKVIC